MKILGELVEVEPHRLYVPWFHRVAPSLQSGTRVHCRLFRGDRPELYLCPFPANSWTDLWRIDCDFTDRPGLFASLTEVLADTPVNVNIVANESMTLGAADQNLFHVSLICDMTGYGDRDNPDGTSPSRAQDPDANLQYLCDYLAIKMFHDVRFRLGRPQIFANRLRELHSVGLLAKKLGHQLVRTFTAPVRSGIVDIPDFEWDVLMADRTPSPDGRFLVTVASDTEERYVKIGALPAEKDVFLVSVQHTDKPGKIASFADILRSEFGAQLNINCNYTRVVQAHEKAVWRCLLEVEAGQKESVKNQIRQLFDDHKPFLGDSRISVGFPDPISITNEPSFNNSRTSRRRS